MQKRMRNMLSVFKTQVQKSESHRFGPIIVCEISSATQSQQSSRLDYSVLRVRCIKALVHGTYVFHATRVTAFY